MRMHRGLFGWGIFLILAGSIPLAVRAGYLSTDQLGGVVRLWPLILVGIGVGLILSRTRFAFLGGFIVAATFGVIVGGLLAGGVAGFATGACGSTAGTTPFPTGEGTFEGSSASVRIELNCGSATVSVASGTAWRIEGEDEAGNGPTIESTANTLPVRSRNADGGFFVLGKRESWRIVLPGALGLDAQLILNAGSSTLDLDGATLNRLEATVNAGSAIVDLGSVETIHDLQIVMNAGSLGLILPSQSLSGSIQANAGSVELCAPAGAALRLETSDSIVASYEYEDQGLVKNGSIWETPGYDSAAVKIDLRTSANAGSFSLNPGDGCAG